MSDNAARSSLHLRGWRDEDPPRPSFGLVVRRTGADLYVGRRLYRAYWPSRKGS